MSHISVGRYAWIQFQHEEILLWVTSAHWTQRTSLLWFPVGRSTVRLEPARGESRVRTDIGDLVRLIAIVPSFLNGQGKK